MEQLYSRARFQILAVNDRLVVLATDDNDIVTCLSKQDFRLLYSASKFKTLNSHAAAFSRLFRDDVFSSDIDSIRRKLNDFVSRKLLVSASFLLDAKLPQVVSPKISSLGIVTRDRPLCVKRCVYGLLENLVQSSSCTALRVYDDSSDSETSKFMRSDDLLRRIPTHISLYYASAERKANFVNRLSVEANVSTDVLSFALRAQADGLPAFGANLNCLLLDTIGELIATTDDDVTGKVGIARGFSQKLSLSSEDDPTSTALFSSSEDAQSQVQWLDTDALKLHELLLGKSIAECVSEASSNEGVLLEKASLSSDMFSGLNTKILVTMLGIVGSPGTYSKSWFHLAHRQPDIVSDEKQYQRLRYSTNVIRTVPRVTVAAGQLFMNPFAGFDNRAELPPFFPVLRNMDGIFVKMLRSIHGRLAIGYLPWVIEHAPMEMYATGAMRPNAKIFPRLSELIIQTLRDQDIKSWTSDDRLRMNTMGLMFCEIGAMKPSQFSQWLRQQCVKYWALQLISFDNLLMTSKGACSLWKKEVNDYIEVLKNVLADSSRAVIDDLTGCRSVLNMERTGQALIKQFGCLLLAWPDVRQVCRELNINGVRIAEQIR